MQYREINMKLTGGWTNDGPVDFVVVANELTKMIHGLLNSTNWTMKGPNDESILIEDLQNVKIISATIDENGKAVVEAKGTGLPVIV